MQVVGSFILGHCKLTMHQAETILRFEQQKKGTDFEMQLLCAPVFFRSLLAVFVMIADGGCI